MNPAPLKVHIIHRASDQCKVFPDYRAMLNADWVFVVTQDGTARCIKGDGDVEPVVTYEVAINPDPWCSVGHGEIGWIFPHHERKVTPDAEAIDRARKALDDVRGPLDTAVADAQQAVLRRLAGFEDLVRALRRAGVIRSDRPRTPRASVGWGWLGW